MKLKIFLAGLALCMSTTAFAKEKPTLNDDVDAGVKTAVESAIAANKSAKAADVEWIWANPVGDIWEKTRGLMSSTNILDQTIEMANAGKNEAAIKAANYIENAAKQGLEQSKLIPKASPAQYGL
uniref:Uncharacterized protein n=1 Tax=uncultured Thiotrichaceae bacterium TaxID=298394 RepID=A0A6S6TN03_9GAMM|nr:MAG: Unknown protein [uncultured Thiotrichaceae bacterium]